MAHLILVDVACSVHSSTPFRLARACHSPSQRLRNHTIICTAKSGCIDGLATMHHHNTPTSIRLPTCQTQHKCCSYRVSCLHKYLSRIPKIWWCLPLRDGCSRTEPRENQSMCIARAPRKVVNRNFIQSLWGHMILWSWQALQQNQDAILMSTTIHQQYCMDTMAQENRVRN